MKKKFKITFNSPVILGFAGICLIAMLLNKVTFGESNRLLFMTYHSHIASPLTFILVSVIYIGQQIVEGIAGQDNISQMAHIFGGIVGGIAGFLLNRKRVSAGK